jgi:hypothetical protein
MRLQKQSCRRRMLYALFIRLYFPLINLFFEGSRKASVRGFPAG